MNSLLSETEVRSRLTSYVCAQESQRAAARLLGFSQPYIADVLLGRRAISEKLAEKLGFMRIVMFQRVSVGRPCGERAPGEQGHVHCTKPIGHAGAHANKRRDPE